MNCNATSEKLVEFSFLALEFFVEHLIFFGGNSVYFYPSINVMVALDIKKNSSCTCGIGNELSFFREKTGVLPDSVNFLSFIDNLHETGPSEPGVPPRFRQIR